MTLAAFPAHSEYKASGYDWVGDVPAHWAVEKLGTCLTSVSRKGRPDLPLLSITREEGVIERDVDDQESNHNFIPEDLSNYKVLRAGQFGMNKMKAWQGSYGISNHTGIVSPAYFVFDITREVDPAFFNRALRSKLYVSYFAAASDGVRIGQWDLSKTRMREIPVLLPPLPEQRAIAAFLDEKCAKVDEAVRIKEEQIALLRERRQILIQQAVTRGLNPAAPMKDSGIDWIGQIPAHWERRKVRHLFSIGRGRVIPKDELVENGLYPVYSSQTKNDGIFGYLNSYDFDQDQLTWTTDGANAGTVFRRRGKHNCTNVCGTLSPKTNDTDLDFCVHAVGHAALFYKRPDTNGAKIMNEEMAAIEFPLPPMEEQILISRKISEVSEKFENAYSIKEDQIAALKEYKTSLINAAVTGKIKVA